MTEPHHRHHPPPTTASTSTESSHLLRHLSLLQEDDRLDSGDDETHDGTTKRLFHLPKHRGLQLLAGAALALAAVVALARAVGRGQRPTAPFPRVRPGRFSDGDIIPIEGAREHYLTIPHTTLRLWYRVWGNQGPTGVPVLFVHGGPGNAVADYGNGNRRFFRPDLFRVVEVDQRGTGRSEPSVRRSAGNMRYYANVSIDQLADDYELVREHLGVDRWLVWGGSYGSTVALTYAARHPARCRALVVRGIYLESRREVAEVYSRRSYLDNAPRRHEFDVLYDYAAQDLQRRGEPPLDPDDAERLLRTYERLIQQGDRHAVWHWWVFENNLMEWDPANLRDPFRIRREDYPQAQSVAFFETRLWVHGTYEAPSHILDHLSEVARLPIWLCQGLKDEVCPYENARRLVDALEDHGATQVTARFIDAGHEDTDPTMERCLHQSIREFIQVYRALP